MKTTNQQKDADQTYRRNLWPQLPLEAGVLALGIVFVGLLIYLRVWIFPSYDIHQQHIYASEHLSGNIARAYILLTHNRLHPGRSLNATGISAPVMESGRLCQVLRGKNSDLFISSSHLYLADLKPVVHPDGKKLVEDICREVEGFRAALARDLANAEKPLDARWQREYVLLANRIEEQTERFESLMQNQLARNRRQNNLISNLAIGLFVLLFIAVSVFIRRSLVESRRTNQQLTESVARNRAIVDTAVESILIADDKGIIRSANRAAEQVFGYTADEMVGNNIAMLIPGDDSDRHHRYIDRYLKGDSSRIIGTGREVKGKRKDGSIFPMHIGVSVSHVGDKTLFTGIIWDLSREKENEIRIAESESELRAILQNMQDTFFRTDQEGRLTRISASVEALLGYTAEELLGTRLEWLYVQADGLETFLAALHSKGGRIEHYEAALRHKNGNEVWVSTNAHFVRDKTGQTIGIEGTSRDVSEHRFMEIALRASESKFRTLAESSNVGIFVCQDNRLVYANDAESRLTGYSNRELLNMDFWQMVHPDFLKAAPQWIEQEWSSEYVPSQCELQLLTRDGKSIWVEYSGTLVDYRNKPAGMGTIVDITHLKDAEQKLQDAKHELEQRVRERTKSLLRVNKELRQEIQERQRAEKALRDKALIIDQIHESVVSTDLKGNVTSWNRGAEKLFGYSEQEMLGHFIGKVYPEDMQDFLLNQIILPLQQKGAYETEVRMRHKAGDEFYALLSLSMLYDTNGDANGMIGYALDISERRRAEEKIVQDYRAQGAINAILKTSLEQVDLEEQLTLALDQLFLIPRFSWIKHASIFLATDNILDQSTSAEKRILHRTFRSTSLRMMDKHINGYTITARDNPSSAPHPADPADSETRSPDPVSIPILSLGKLLGIFYVLPQYLHTAPPEDMDFLNVIGNILAGIVERSRAQQGLTDALREKNMIMDTVQDIIIKLDTENRLVSWNRELEVVTGYSAKEMYFAGPELFFGRPDLDKSYQTLEQCLRDGHAYGEIDLKLKNGNSIPYQWAISSLTDNDGKVIGFTGVGRDLSDRIEAERRRLADAERQRDALVREVHHRVKNNLQGIVGLLRHYTMENPGTRDVLENAIGQIHSMALMYGLQSKHSDDEVLLNDMATAMAENAQSLTRAAVSVDTGCEGIAQCAISARENVAVALVLNELIFNAIKHSPDVSEKSVSVSVEKYINGALVQVRNQGRLPRHFDWQSGNGTGTGLTLVRSLLPTQGVVIDIRNERDGVVADLRISPPVLITYTIEKAGAIAS